MKRQIKVIDSSHTLPFTYLRQAWKFRSYAITFARQELKVQYTQTIFGALWAFFRPLIILATFTFIFDKVIPIHGLKYPYPLFAFSGLIAWNYFSFIVNYGSAAIATNQQLILKIYFPRIILIFSKILVGGVEFGAALFLLLIMIIILRYPVSPNLIWLPFFLLLNIITGLTFAIWFSALSVRFRDLNHFIPQAIGFFMWLSPVFYPVALVPSSYSFYFFLNPLAGVIQGFRFAILGDFFPPYQYFFCFVPVLIFLISGFLFFIRIEDDMPDYL
jgi:lipopolysaccharide transport system permease protein